MRKLLLIIFLLLPTTVHAAAKSINDICGAGGTLFCIGSDDDADGYDDTTDCDEANRYVYPGVSIGCDFEGAGANTGWQTCQNDTNYTSCTANSSTPYTAHTGSGATYYIDVVNGSDSNDGSYATPWASQTMFSYYASGAPSGHHTPVAGDAFLFFDGTYSVTYTSNNANRMLFLNNNDGTSSNHILIKEYPGHSPIFDPGFTSGTKGTVITFWWSSYVDVEGLEITGGFGEGVFLAGDTGDEVNTFSRMHIHHIDGDKNDNPGAIVTSGCDDCTFHHNLIHDNYDTTGDATENNKNVSIFGGAPVNFHHNVVYNTLDISNETAVCFAMKHGSSVGPMKIDDNIFFNCKYYAIGSGGHSTYIRNNRIYASVQCMQFRDHGGVTFHDDEKIQNNTCVNSGEIDLIWSDTYVAFGTLLMENNIIVDDVSSYSTTGGMVVVKRFGSDANYATIHDGGLFTFRNNCYYNSVTAVKFCDMCSDSGGQTDGGQFTFSTWKSTQGHDTSGSFEEDPVLNADDEATAGNCSSYGWNVAIVEGGGGSGSGDQRPFAAGSIIGVEVITNEDN